MNGSFFTRIVHHAVGMSTMWIIVWIGLVILSVALVLLTRTRWGQSRPLRKCAVLSILAHVLLGCIATTVQIVSGVTGTTDAPSVRVSIVHGPQATDDRADRSMPQTPQPWAAVTTDSAIEPDTGQLARPDHPTPIDTTPPESTAVQGVPDKLMASVAKQLSPPLPDHASPDPSLPDGVDVTEPGPPAGRGAAAEPIQAPKPQRQDPPDIESMLPSPEVQRAANTPLPEIGRQSLPAEPSPQPIQRVMPKPRPQTSPENVPDPILANPILAAKSAAAASRVASPVPAPTDDALLDGRTSERARVMSLPAGSSQQDRTNRGNAGEQIADAQASSETRPASPDVYRDRTSRNRDDLVRARGGSGDTEAAVRAALKWLANNQGADGRWDADQHGAGQERASLDHDRQGAGIRADTGITGLALLAFLGAGHTHLDGTHRKTVLRGLEFLLRRQAPSGNLAGDATLYARMYCHAMATFALSEAYAMTGDERLLAAAERAVRYSMAAQDIATGGWRYQPGDEGDTSQLGWQVMALRSAKLAGIKVHDETWHRVRRFLHSVSSGIHGGLASYRPRAAPSRAMTAEALVCRQLSGQAPNDRADQEAVDYVLQELPGDGRVNLYYWYYATLGLFQDQGPGWESWNRALATALVPRQETTGKMTGSWSTDTVWGGSGGRVYTTAMGALCLEVYYRYARPVEVTAGRWGRYK